MAARTALIAGAGIGGLAAAVALQRADWSVRVFERAAEPRELGFALLLAPNAVASLARLGLAERIIEQGSEMDAGEIRGAGGRVLRRFGISRVRHLLPQPVVVVLRPALHGVLSDAVGLAHIQLTSEVRDFAVQDGKPIVRLASGQSTEGDVLVGADGVGSTVRRVLHPQEPPPRRSGLWAVRGVAHGLDPDLISPIGAQYFGRGTEAGLARAGHHALYWYISVRADQLDNSFDARAIARRCAAEFDAPLQTAVGATRPEDMRLDELLDRDPIASWGRGPITLLGDAAHPMLPHAGQGAAQALEDAVALGHVLARTVDVEPALRRYEQVRAQRTRNVVGIARRNARIGSISNRMGQALRDLAIRTVPASTFTRAFVEFGNPPPIDPA